jgi:DMSO/TMAO reductase YedYZ molybdopterin-dependent catalytic subunit
MFWVANGIIYVTLLLTTDNWQRLIPTSWDVFPRAFHTLLTYASFHLPAASEFRPYDPLQQLAYASVVFVMAPLTILSGMAMSPVMVGHWPWYQKLFGNRQIARSLHFILAVGYLAFFVVHVSLVALTGFSANMNRMVLGGTDGPNFNALMIGLAAIAFVIFINALATWYSAKSPARIQNTLGHFTDRVTKTIFKRLKSRQEYGKEAISPFFWVNGRPPETATYRDLQDGSFGNYRLAVNGLVERPLLLSLDDLKNMPRRTQITLHNCIQGWSGIAQWTGLPVAELLKICKPLPEAKYVVFHSFGEDEDGREFYGTLDIEDASSAQTILAYEMNGVALTTEYGAPLRLRVETKLGFKMTKYLKSIELIADYKTIGLGQGGYREDRQYFGTVAGI